MSKNTITKWLVVLNTNQALEIKEKEVSQYAPINRLLDVPGHYNFDIVSVDQTRYIVVYQQEEEYQNKTKLLIARIHDDIEKVIDMTKDDYQHVIEIARRLMGYVHLTV